MLTAPAPELFEHAVTMDRFPDGPSCQKEASLSTPWQSAKLSALRDAIQVWFLPAGQGPGTPAFTYLESLLSADERARAASFHFPVHRTAFVTNRACLRILLARYLDSRPESIQFVYGAQGKPEVAEAESEGLTFNLSHTEDLAAIAVARGRRVGVDVEQVRLAADLLELAQHHFSAGEYQQLAALPSRQQLQAFYACWTRKEAFLKGLGTGLAQELSAFQVSFLPDERARLLACQWSPDLCQSWRFHALDAGDRHVGALAYELHPHDLPLHLQTFNWSRFTNPAEGN